MVISGAKYTLTHVARSAEFAAKFLPPFRVTADEVRVVQLAIQCTGLRVDTSKLEFREKRELLLGCALGAGDMLGQLASESYPDRLPALYEEFQEGGVSGYTSAEDLMRKTRIFFEGHIRHMLDVQWGEVDVALEKHYTDGQNLYLLAINANLSRIDAILARTHA